MHKRKKKNKLKVRNWKRQKRLIKKYTNINNSKRRIVNQDNNNNNRKKRKQQQRFMKNKKELI